MESAADSGRTGTPVFLFFARLSDGIPMADRGLQ